MAAHALASCNLKHLLIGCYCIPSDVKVGSKRILENILLVESFQFWTSDYDAIVSHLQITKSKIEILLENILRFFFFIIKTYSFKVNLAT